MASVQDAERAEVAPAAVRVCVCGPDDELRGWIAEELLLITWIGGIDVVSVAGTSEDDLKPQLFDLVIAGVDGLVAGDAERLAKRAWTTPLIVVGSTLVAADRVLGAKLTSRDLKQAVRELLASTR